MNQALGRLEKGIQLQREFTADAAHELRTPLAVLRARVETFPDQATMSALRADLDIMANVICQLLDIAEIEGSTLCSTARCDLRATCVEAVSMIADLVIAQGKEIALTGGDRPVWIRGNSSMVFRAVRNLIDNAIRHAPRETLIEVEVSPDGSVKVKDRGPGVPEAERSIVFQRFWRSRRDNSDGAGLGLAIVSRIAELHQAKIAISDNAHGGAVFSLSFHPAPHA
jgi:signal transduction histidine kinase